MKIFSQKSCSTIQRRTVAKNYQIHEIQVEEVDKAYCGIVWGCRFADPAAPFTAVVPSGWPTVAT